MQWRKDNYLISDDTNRVDLDVVEALLRTSYWAADRPRAVMAAGIGNSTCFVLLHDNQQVGFARVISDRATFAWIADVIIAPAHRGRGLGKWLMECVLAHPCTAGVRAQVLATRDAHGLYERYGFERCELMRRTQKLPDNT